MKMRRSERLKVRLGVLLGCFTALAAICCGASRQSSPHAPESSGTSAETPVSMGAPRKPVDDWRAVIVEGARSIAGEVGDSSAFVPDWSTAGYRHGGTPPRPKVTHRVTDFGARPDDAGDDTVAFRRALAETAKSASPVVLEVPAGKYLLSDILFIERGDFVLRGAGSERTVLEFTRPLRQMSLPPRITQLEKYLVDNDKKVDGEHFSPFSWTGGVIWTRRPGADEGKFDELVPLEGPPISARAGKRGGRTFELSSGETLDPGETYVLRWANREGERSSFLAHLYGSEPSSWGDRLVEDPERTLVQQDATVVSQQGNAVTIREPLLHDVRPEWKVELGRVARLTEVGIEHLTVAFPDVPYRGHHKEAGFNALHLNDLRHSWVRDVRIVNADSGVLSDRSSHVTLEEIVVEGRPGHYGIHWGSVYGCLAKDFSIAPAFAHSISFNTRSAGNVFFGGTVVDGSLDQHRGINHQNLFDSIVARETGGKSRLFNHGGAKYFGPPHGAFNAFWNIRVEFSRPTDRVVELGAVEGAGEVIWGGVITNGRAKVRYQGARLTTDPRKSLYLAQQVEAP